jgi:pescadillo protein
MKKLQKGKTYYSLEDILHLTHEPVIWKFWEFKIFMRRLKRATARKDFDAVKCIQDNKPFYKLDHIVKERYPTFVDAIRDLDDALSMVFLYARFPQNQHANPAMIAICRRLCIEFMHYVIETRSLRKVFVSVKGYYFQAEIHGQAVTWITPHDFVIPNTAEVDIRVMKSFTEFYVHLLGFVNYRLYNLNNLVYPPKVVVGKVNPEDVSLMEGNDAMKEYVEALNRSLVKKISEPMETDAETDVFEDPSQTKDGDEEDEVKGAVGLTYSQTVKLQNLFEGMVFFLNREVPREKLTFLIRSFGGQVSWHASSAIGSIYDESDDKITHQVVDREVLNKRLDRVYIQPQWIFDSINLRKVLAVQDYFPGLTLPPHMSPFVDESKYKPGTYVTPDAVRLQGQKPKPVQQNNNKKTVEKSKDSLTVEGPKKNKGDTFVKAGKLNKGIEKREEETLEREHKRLAEMMIPRKKKVLYDKILKLRKSKVKQSAKLTAKRQEIERKQMQTS